MPGGRDVRRRRDVRDGRSVRPEERRGHGRAWRRRRARRASPPRSRRRRKTAGARSPGSAAGASRVGARGGLLCWEVPEPAAGRRASGPTLRTLRVVNRHRGDGGEPGLRGARFHLGARRRRLPRARPGDAVCKGMFFRDVLAAVRYGAPLDRNLDDDLGPHARPLHPFRTTAARPHGSTARAARLCTRPPRARGAPAARVAGLSAFVQSMVGRVVLGVLGSDLEQVSPRRPSRSSCR